VKRLPVLLVVALVSGLLAVLLAGPAQADPGDPGPDAPATPPTTEPAQPGQPVPVAPEPEPQVWTGYPGTNEAHAEHGYPWPAAPDCDESDVGTGGCVNDGLGFFQGQCTSWVAHRLGQRNGIAFSNWYLGVHWGNASEWAKVARGQGFKPDRVPAEGAVGWYARGHVSYVESVNPDGSIVISEMNTDGHNGFHLTTVAPGGAGWPDRFLHLADVVPVDHTPPARPGDLAAVPAERGVAVTWERPADDLGVTGYTVLRDGIAVAETDTASYVDRQASPGQPYTYAVTAHDAAGNVSEEAAARVSLGVRAPQRLARLFLPDSARLVEAGERTLACGRLGTLGNQRVGCAVRTAAGPAVVRTGRAVPWGTAASQAFLADAEGRVWFCRSLEARGDASACLPLDVADRTWGYDRIDHARSALTGATWVAGPDGPARCGLRSDRASCSVVTDEGWTAPRRADDARPGDPLSRAFVPTERGVGFCRVVEGRAACTELGGQARWRRTVAVGEAVAHGRWVSRPAGVSLCPTTDGACRPVVRTGR
jgi:surface antigen